MSKFISISSKDATSSNSTMDFRILLNTPIENVRSIKSVHVTMPLAFYTVMSGINDKIYITAASVTYTATLSSQLYANFTALATEVQTQLNAAYTPDNNFTCTYSATTHKFTISHSATNFQLTFATNTTASARRLIGFSQADTASGLSSISDISPNMQYSDTIFIRSNELSNNNSWVGSERKGFIFSFPLDGNFGDTITYQSQGDDWSIYYYDQGGKYIRDIDIQVVFEDLTTIVPNRGGDIRLTFLFENASPDT
jgi:hypothetical protein